MIKVFPVDQYSYLEYTILLDERTLAQLGNLHLLLHISQSRKGYQSSSNRRKPVILLNV